MTTKAMLARIAAGLVALGPVLAATPALAEAAGSKIDPAATAWMMAASGLALMMTIPGPALVYCGMVRKKNVLATMAQRLVCTGLCSLLWFAVRHSLRFPGE